MSIIFSNRNDKEIIFDPNKISDADSDLNSTDKEITFVPSKIADNYSDLNSTDKEITFVPSKIADAYSDVNPNDKEITFNPSIPNADSDLNSSKTSSTKPDVNVDNAPSINPDEQNGEPSCDILQQLNWKAWTVILILGYIILKSAGAFINLEQWSSTDLLIALIVIGLAGFWIYKGNALKEGV